ncbi:MAG: HAD family hydrolase [Sporichthyaceae bacterium]
MRPELVLLDRDGTLNVPVGTRRYVVDPAEVDLLPGAADAVRRLNDAGVPVVVVTNQRGVGTGVMTGEQLTAVHDAIADQLAASGAHVDGWYVCPHDVDACDCRKPLPGLVLQALAARPGVRPGRCVLVGDSEGDVVAARAAGVPGLLLAALPPTRTVARAVLPSLADAVRWILRDDDDTVTAG